MRMKKMFFLAVAAVATVVACNKPDNPQPKPGPDPAPETKDEVSVSPASVAFEGEGGTLRVAVTTNVNDYAVTGNPDWLTVTTSGKEISLTAAQNTVNEARSATLTVTAGKASASISVSQKAGSPYYGYTVLKEARMDYGGTMLYAFMKPTEEEYGGWATLELFDEDQNELVCWIYTDLFLSAEEVELTTGTYVKGADDYQGLSLAAKKVTYMAGMLIDDEEESYATGTYFVSAATEQQIPLVNGTIEVTRNGEAYVILVNLTDAAGNAYKYVFEGELVIDTEGAVYPGDVEHIDVGSSVFAATCLYLGDVYGNGTSNFMLYVYSGDEESPAQTVFEFNAPAAEFAEDLDLSGEYYTPSEPQEGEEPGDPHGAGTLVPGSLVEIVPGFEMPMGTYVMYTFGDYLIADAFASLQLTKQEDGKYTLSGALMSTAGEMAMFMGSDFTGIHDLAIEIIDGRDNGDDED